MSEEKTYTLQEAQQHFARALNGQVWDLLQKSERTNAEDERMIYVAYASGYHWLVVGGELNHQRSEWLLSHVFATLGERTAALHHAKRCMQLTEDYQDQMANFDVAYAYEALARAYAISDQSEKAGEYIQLVEEAGQKIANDEDKTIFFGDFQSGFWNGYR